MRAKSARGYVDRRDRRVVGGAARRADGPGAPAAGHRERPGAAHEDERQMLPQMRLPARRLPGLLRAKVCRHVHGPLHGLLESSLAHLHQSSPTRET